MKNFHNKQHKQNKEKRFVKDSKDKMLKAKSKIISKKSNSSSSTKFEELSSKFRKSAKNPIENFKKPNLNRENYRPLPKNTVLDNRKPRNLRNGLSFNFQFEQKVFDPYFSIQQVREGLESKKLFQVSDIYNII